MNVVITGGTGYIGAHLALDLARAGHAVTAIARPERAGTTSAARADALRTAGVTLAHADLSLRGSLAALDASAAEVIVHGVCSFLEPAEGESLTLRAMEEVLAFARRAPRLRQFIDLSNNLVLAPPAADALPDEDAPCEPETAHGRNKLAAERMLQRAGIPWVVLRIGQVYGGVGSSFDWVMIHPIRHGEFPVPCDGRNRVALVHVDDVVQATRRVIDLGVRDRVFNVASGDSDLTLGAVFDEIAKGFGLPPPRRLPRAAALAYMGSAERWSRLRGEAPTRVADMVRVLSENRSLSIARARDELGYAPEHPDTLRGIREAYADVFAGRAQAFAPAGRLGHAQGVSGPSRAPTPAEFWQRWTSFRHGEPGSGTFADVMRVLRLHDAFAAWSLRGLSRSGAVTVLDLGCGAAQMAPCLARALDADGRALGRYVGVDAADPAWMVPRTAREFAFHGLVGRGSYVHHDLATGLPPSMDDALAGDGPLLITSCWGITYLAHDPLVALLRACDALAATRAAGASMTVNLMSAAAFDRDVLTRRFLSEVVPRHVVRAARDRRLTPLREIRLALRALPRMRAFGDEVQRVAKLMPVPEFLATVQEAGLTVTEVDPSALWGQTTSVRIALGGRKTA